MPFGQPRNAPPLSFHACYRTLQNLAQTLWESVFGGQRRVRLPLPPAVVMFGYSQCYFPPQAFWVSRYSKVPGAANSSLPQ